MHILWCVGCLPLVNPCLPQQTTFTLPNSPAPSTVCMQGSDRNIIIFRNPYINLSPKLKDGVHYWAKSHHKEVEKKEEENYVFNKNYENLLISIFTIVGAYITLPSRGRCRKHI